MRLPTFLRLCRCALAGEPVALVAAGPNRYRCQHCGSSERGVRAARALVQEEWTAGGAGYRPAPRTFLGHLWACRPRLGLWQS